MAVKMRESFYSVNDSRKWFPSTLSCVVLILLLTTVNSANPSELNQLCDSDLMVPIFEDFNIKVLHLTATSVHIKWFIPLIIQKTAPDYYCIVYNSQNVIAGKNREFVLTDLKPNIFYNINVKPCVNRKCFAKSFTLRVHT